MTARGPLDHWQERLEQHFEKLARAREGSNFPIFALEHGLTDDDLRIIPQVLDRQIRTGIPILDHWLVWAVYAAESGYRYDGHEYWHSFEKGMPRWRDAGRPDHLRIFFRMFQKKYNGFVPTGPWAGHFRNICWPITHAILPKYLQAQIAKTMFDARHQLARIQNATASEAGKLLARNTWDASSRFQEFLEQPELAGRIVLSMLGQSGKETHSSITEPTLARIVTDLTRIRNAGEWLKATRQAVNDRFYGAYKPGAGDASGRPGTHDHASSTVPMSIRPKLLLRRAADSTWAPVIEVPGFDDVARLSPDLRRFLQTTRCRVTGTDSGLLPAGWTLYGTQRRSLTTWPGAGDLLISFEKSHGILDNILRGECRFSSGPIWLFRVGSDGLGREVSGMSVRPGQRYVALSRTPLAPALSFLTNATVTCDGVSAIELNLPEAIQPRDAAELHQLNIQVSRSIRVWPAGLCPPSWDGEGHGEWLSTEEPCLGFSHDHPVEEYFLTVNNGPETRVEGSPAGRAVFVRLPRLHPGRHTVSIRPRRIGISMQAPIMRELEGRLELNIRDPKPRKLGITAHSGLMATVDPPNPSLGEFCDGSARLSVLGPEGRDARCRIALTGPDGNMILDEEIGRLPLPIMPNNWTPRIKRFANDPARAWTYAEATRGTFTVNAEELGRFSLPLERSTTPLRWACRFNQLQAQVRLFDDTGIEAPATVQFYALKRPAAAQAIDSGGDSNSYQVPDAGGLYYASHGDHTDLIVVSNAQGVSTLDQLRLQPDLDTVDHDAPALLHIISLWYRARMAGPLADWRRSHVLATLLDRLYLMHCGPQWMQLEHSQSTGQDSIEKLKLAVDKKPSFAAALNVGHGRLSGSLKDTAVWFSALAQRHGICTDPAICTFALELASVPFSVGTTYGARLNLLLDGAKQHPPLLRGARFLALLSLVAEPDTSNLRLPRWR